MKTRDYLSECKLIAESRGGSCLSETYVNAHTKLLWKCANGHVWEANSNNIKNGQWCRICSRLALADKQRSGLGVCISIAEARGGVCVSTDYINNRAPLAWHCAAGHEWQAPLSHIKQGSWCPICASGIGERIVREFFEQLFATPFPKKRPKWLKNSRGNQMELDGFSETLGVAFEHQGQQHFRYISLFHKGETHLRQRIADDETKRKLCKDNGVILVEVPEIPILLPYEDVKTYVASWIEKENPSTALKDRLNLFPGIEVSYLKAYAIQPLKEIERVAQVKGGEVLSSHYLGIFHPLEFRCQLGHIFKKQPVNLLHNDQWCPFCARIRQKERCEQQRKPLHALRALAQGHGGRLLSQESMGAHKGHEWICAREHTFFTTPANVLMGKWCPQCAKEDVAERTREEFARNFEEVIKQHQGHLLSPQYTNAKSKVRIQCKAGHEWTARPDAVVRGSWCPICKGGIRHSIENAKVLAEGHDGFCVSTSYTNSHSPLEWRCKNGHIFKKTYTKVQQGQWCPVCRKDDKNNG